MRTYLFYTKNIYDNKLIYKSFYWTTTFALEFKSFLLFLIKKKSTKDLFIWIFLKTYIYYHR